MKSENLLYHYTSIDAAVSIMQSETLYLTNHQSLNDPTEFLHADDLLINAYKQAYDEIFAEGKLITSLRGRDYKAAVNTDSKMATDVMRTVTGFDYYIFSTTQHTDKYDMANGTLVMWRGYKGGCAIVFDRQKLIKIVDALVSEEKALTTITDKVLYAKEENDIKQHFKDEYQLFVHWLKHSFSSVLNPDGVPLYNFVDGLNPYIKMKALTKHHAFESEEEYRIAILRSIPKVNSTSNSLIKIDEFKGNRIIKLPIGLNGLPIKKIIVSPFTNQGKDFKILEDYKKSKPQLMNIDIIKSKIPHS